MQKLVLVLGARPHSAALAIGKALLDAGHVPVHTVSSALSQRMLKNPTQYYETPSELEYILQAQEGGRVLPLDVTSDTSIAQLLAYMQRIRQKTRLEVGGMAYLAAGGGSAKRKVIGVEMPELSEDERQSAQRVNYGGIERILTLDMETGHNLFPPGAQILALTFLAGMDTVPMTEYGHMRELKQDLFQAMQDNASQFPYFGFSLVSTGPFPSMSAQQIPRFEEFLSWYAKHFPQWGPTAMSAIGFRGMELLTDAMFRGFRLEHLDGGLADAMHAKPEIIQELRELQEQPA